MKDIEQAKEILSAGNYTCVLCKKGDIHTSRARGVKPIVQWYESEQDYHGYSAADKVVGKATAFLYALLGVKAIYAHVISKSALDVLKKHNIHIEYGSLVEHIMNRKGDGICPFESTVLTVDTPDEAYRAIHNKMKEMNISDKE